MPDLDCTASRRAGMTGRAPGFPPRAASISLAARDSGRLIGALGSRSSTHRRGSVLAGATLVSLAITLPIALTHPTPAAGGALVVGARFGTWATSGVPAAFHWEARPVAPGVRVCAALAVTSDEGWVGLEATG